MLPYHLRKGPCPSTGAVATIEQRCPGGGTPAAKSMARSEVHFGDVGLRLGWVGLGWVSQDMKFTQIPPDGMI